jgi:hypothetical protein
VLTPESWALLEKLSVARLLKNFPISYGIRKFITTGHHLQPRQSSPYNSILSNVHLNIILPCTSRKTNGQFSLAVLSCYVRWSRRVKSGQAIWKLLVAKALRGNSQIREHVFKMVEFTYFVQTAMSRSSYTSYHLYCSFQLDSSDVYHSWSTEHIKLQQT